MLKAVIHNPVKEDDLINIIGSALMTPYNKSGWDLNKMKEVIKGAIKNGHDSVLEHANITMDILGTIAVYKALTRHRHCSFTIQSTVYDKSEPSYYNLLPEEESLLLDAWRIRNNSNTIAQAAMARIFMTTNIRQWRYMIQLRLLSNPKGRGEHDETMIVFREIYNTLVDAYPFFFGGIDVWKT